MIDWTSDPGRWATSSWRQSWSYGETLRTLGTTVLRAVGPWGQAQILARRRFGVWIATCAAAPELPADIWRQLRRLPLRGPKLLLAQPDAPSAALRQAGMRMILTGGATARIDLTRPLDDLMAAQTAKWRNRLRAAQRDGLRARAGPMPAARLGWLLDLEARQQRARRYAGHPPALIAEWDRRRGPGERLVLVEIRRGAARVAAMLFVVTGRHALYQIGWQTASNAHSLALWAGVEHLKAAGAHDLDLGRDRHGPRPRPGPLQIGIGRRARGARRNLGVKLRRSRVQRNFSKGRAVDALRRAAYPGPMTALTVVVDRAAA